MRRRSCLGWLAAATLSLGGCLTAETSEHRQLMDLERGIENDRFAVDPTRPQVMKADPPTDRAASPPSPATPRFEPRPEPMAVEVDDGADPTPRPVIRIWGKNAASVEVAPAIVPAKVAF